MKTAIQPTLFDTADFDKPVDFDESVALSETVSASEKEKERLLRQLRAQIGCLTTASPETTETFSSGADCVDRLLPRRGLRVDGITEWTADAAGCGAASLAMIAAATRLSTTTGPLVVVGGQGTFYPPAAVSLGVSDDRILWVRPSRHADLVWAIDQSLRCKTVAAVWAHVGPHLNDRDARRFQLAAETGNTPGLFIRPASVRGRPSFADVRFHVTGQLPDVEVASVANSRPARLIRIVLDRCRGGGVGQSVWVEVDGRAGVRAVVPQCPQIQNTEIQNTGIQRPGITLASPHIDSHSLHSANHHEAATVRLASELAHPASAKPARPRRRA